ncbi:MAG: CvpA family protein [Dethiobacter sp.]|jgi:uncharacterized membrane protein required for colicin V production|nr:CvpA family protein [Dethiobacter sp.]
MINWLDIVLLVLIFYSAVSGWRRGLVRQLFDIAGIFIAYFVALRYSVAFMDWLSQYLPFQNWLPAWFTTQLPIGFILGDVLVRLLGFVLLFFIVRALIKVFSEIVHGIFSLPLLGTVNGLGGLAVGSLKGILLAIILVAVLKLVGTAFWRTALENSVVATSILDWLLPAVYEQMQNILLTDLPPAV